MMKLSDLFDFSFYERHPEWQTKEEWTHNSTSIYLSQVRSGTGSGLTVEERSLELFGHEKFLLDSDLFPDGKGFLTRIGYQKRNLKW